MQCCIIIDILMQAMFRQPHTPSVWHGGHITPQGFGIQWLESTTWQWWHQGATRAQPAFTTSRHPTRSPSDRLALESPPYRTALRVGWAMCL